MAAASRRMFVFSLFATSLCAGGCAPKVLIEFRYVESQKPVSGGEVVIRPAFLFAKPLGPLKVKNAMTSANGGIELSLNWDPGSEAKALELTEADGAFHMWYLGDNEYTAPFIEGNWVGEQGEWVEGFTDTRKYERVELRLIEK